MLANGYVPIPLSGKKPTLAGWPNMTVNEERFVVGSHGANTGVRTTFTPVFDIDILARGAARLVEESFASTFRNEG